MRILKDGIHGWDDRIRVSAQQVYETSPDFLCPLKQHFVLDKWEMGLQALLNMNTPLLWH